LWVLSTRISSSFSSLKFGVIILPFQQWPTSRIALPSMNVQKLWKIHSYIQIKESMILDIIRLGVLYII
jgi:hypothetical protein